MPCGHPDDQQTLEDLRLQQVGILGCWGDGRLFFLTWWGLNVAFFFLGVKFAKDQRFGGVVKNFFHMEHSPTWCLLDYREVAGGGDSICGSGLSGRRISVGYSVLGCLSDIE